VAIIYNNPKEEEEKEEGMNTSESRESIIHIFYNAK